MGWRYKKCAQDCCPENPAWRYWAHHEKCGGVRRRIKDVFPERMEMDLPPAWTVEYKCPVCFEIVTQTLASTDIVWEVVKHYKQGAQDAKL